MAGSVLLGGLPTIIALLTLWGARPVAGNPAEPAAVGSPTRPGFAAAVSEPTISLSIEPIGLAPASEPQTPVILPGYILPDDGPEETCHAGS